MNRTFKPTTLAEFKMKLEAELLYHDVHGTCCDPSIIREKIDKDLKVDFDWENFEWDNEAGSLMGFQQFKNGLCFRGCTGSGDWEHPVFFIVYHDGKKWRAYIPEDGNVWDKRKKKAYNSDDHDEDFDWAKIKADIEQHIVPTDVAQMKKRADTTLKQMKQIALSQFSTDDLNA